MEFGGDFGREYGELDEIDELEETRKVAEALRLETEKRAREARSREIVKMREDSERIEATIARRRKPFFNEITEADEGIGLDFGPELGENLLETFFDVVVIGSGVKELERLLARAPQLDKDGNPRYLLTGGMAVELLTGFERSHKDLDLVIMDGKDKSKWDMFGTDNVTPARYWANMAFNREFLEQTAVKVKTRPNGGKEVLVVHPAILMVQKLSNAFGRGPRPKDLEDVGAIVRYWEKVADPKEWVPILRTSLEALPKQSRAQTMDRLESMVQPRFR